jgi:hypothetical protein
VSVLVVRGGEPFDNLGLHRELTLSAAWTPVELKWTAEKSAAASVSFQAGASPAPLEIRNFIWQLEPTAPDARRPQGNR